MWGISERNVLCVNATQWHLPWLFPIIPYWTQLKVKVFIYYVAYTGFIKTSNMTFKNEVSIIPILQKNVYYVNQKKLEKLPYN